MVYRTLMRILQKNKRGNPVTLLLISGKVMRILSS